MAVCTPIKRTRCLKEKWLNLKLVLVRCHHQDAIDEADGFLETESWVQIVLTIHLKMNVGVILTKVGYEIIYSNVLVG